MLILTIVAIVAIAKDVLLNDSNTIKSLQRHVFMLFNVKITRISSNSSLLNIIGTNLDIDVYVRR